MLIREKQKSTKDQLFESFEVSRGQRGIGVEEMVQNLSRGKSLIAKIDKGHHFHSIDFFLRPKIFPGVCAPRVGMYFDGPIQFVITFPHEIPTNL
jgi:hypothetical protein